MVQRPTLFLVADNRRLERRSAAASATADRSSRITSKLSSTTADGMPRRFQLLTRCTDSMPSNRAKALSPPAALMTDLDSTLSMSGKDTRGVYPMSNDSCNQSANGLFTIADMALTWHKVVRLAFDMVGLSEDALRSELRARGVSSQTVTNWKRGRPIPVAQYPVVSQITGVSIDELHGKQALKHAPRATDDPELIANRIASLNPDARKVLLAMIAQLEGPAQPKKKAQGK
jgi:hypothetical protein